GGAYDLIFPHHEAEIAQQEAASGKKPFVKIWLHTGFLTIEGKKMSKSLKNFITIKDFLKNNPPEILRWLIFNFHYRSPINYTPQLLQQTKNSFENILELILKLNLIIKKSKNSFFKFDENYLQKIKKEIDKNLQDDFNTPKSLAIIFDFIKEINLNLFKLSKTEAKLIKKFIIQFFEIFDINLKIEKIPKKILILNEKREQLRNNKQFIQADDLRNKINKLGYKIEDTPFGSIIIKKYD
ncbi:MAG: DALR domain-containing protein, partial [Candidatus Pacearchaeota archaeon]